MKKVLLLVAAIFLLHLLPVAAQVSEGAGDRTDVVVKIDGENETFTVLKDYKKPDQFYYVPNGVRLATRGSGAKKRPVFHLLKYQTKNEETNDLVEGGVLQFAIKLAPGEDVVNQIRSAVAQQFNLNEKKVKLAPLPFKNAEVTIYDLDGDLLTTAFQKPGVAPSFANSEIPFQVQLTNLSAGVYEALTKGGGGIPVYITYTFKQVSIPTGFKVTVDWDQSFSHFSKDEKTKQAFTQWYYYRNWWGGVRVAGTTGVNETHNETLSEILQEKKCIKIESVTNASFTPELANSYINPIIERINKELVEKMTPPEKVGKAAANDPANPGYWRTSSNMSMKNISQVKKGKEVIEMNNYEVSESKSTYGSILGIGNYDDNIKNELVTIMPAGNWNYSFFSVPSVGDGEALAIKKVSLQIVPKYYDAKKKLVQIPKTKAEMVEWKPENGYFTDRKGNEITNVLFPMQAITEELDKKGVSLSDCVYEVNLTVVQGSSILKFQSHEEFLMGGVPVSTPLARIEGVEIDCDIGLTFGDRDDKESLAAVKMKIDSTYPKKSYNAVIKGSTDNKIPVFLVEKEDEGKKNPIKANINFVLFNGKTVAWKHNGRNLRDDDLGLSVMLWDEDYNPEQ